MKTRFFLAGTAFALMLAVALIAAEDKKEGKDKDKEIDLEGVKCIMNPEADAKAETALEYKEGKVFFCCKNCRKKFDEAKEKPAAKANYQLVATKQYKQEKCPLTGNKLNEEQTVEVGKVKVTFCCGNCKGKIAKKEADEQLELCFNDKAFEKSFVLVEDEEGKDKKEEKKDK